MACVFAAPSSGSGKTLISLLISSWAYCKGLNIQTFKVGPDYLDPQLLSAFSGKPCRNLDLVLCGQNWTTESFYRFGGDADLVLVEGVMGLFDGIGSSSEGSTAAIAKHLNIPVILVINSSGQAASIAALVQGFRNQDPGIQIAGVVLNKVRTRRHKELLEESLNAISVKTLGAIPNDPYLKIPSKHLGLAPAHEISNIEKQREKWSQIAEDHLCIDELIGLMNAPIKTKFQTNLQLTKQKAGDLSKILPIAIAEDDAFHFKYEETKEYLEELGMPILRWRPLYNEDIPNEAKGLIIPGGFPEQHASTLAKCDRTKSTLKNFFGKHPIYAECGGMLLLGEYLKDLEDENHEMAGLLPFTAHRGELNVGYRFIKCTKNNLITEKDDNLVGHEFHRWNLKVKGKDINSMLLKKDMNQSWEVKGWKIKEYKEGWSNNIFHASWIHLHLASSPKILIRLRKAMESTSKSE